MNRKISIHSPSKKGNLMAAEGPIQVPTDTSISVQKKKHATFVPLKPIVKKGDLKKNRLEECIGHSLKEEKNQTASNPLDIEKKDPPSLSFGVKKTKNKYENFGPPKSIVGQSYLKEATSEATKKKDAPPVAVCCKKKKTYAPSSLEKRVKKIIRQAEGVTDDGDLIDEEVLKKFVLEIEKSEGFYFSEFPGYIDSEYMPHIYPQQQILDNRYNCPEEYDRYLFLAALAVAEYNKDYGTYYKVVEIKHLNVCIFRKFITFTVIDVRGAKKWLLSRLFFLAFYFIIISSLWCCGFFWREALYLLIRRWTFRVLLANEEDLRHKNVGRSTFRALVEDYVFLWKRDVVSCKLLKEDS